VDPAPGRKVDLHRIRVRVEHRRYHKPGADHKLVLQAGHFGIFWIVNKGMPDDQEPLLGCLPHQLHPVRFPGSIDPGEADEVSERLLVRVELVVELGYVALVGTEHGRKGAEFDPTQQQLLGAMVPEQGIVYGDVATNVRVLQAVA